jgi:superfamily II DNA or RNA helicase
VNTSFKPVIKYNIHGKMDWNALLEDQAADEKRNRLILRIIEQNPSRTFLVLVKRIKQGKWLAKEIADKLGEDYVATLFGSNQTFDRSCKVLIGTNSKIGTGFDFEKLDTLLLAADVVEYYIQFIGRIMRREDVNPVIFDLVDQNKTLYNHFLTRSKVYKKHGGEIKIYADERGVALSSIE